MHGLYVRIYFFDILVYRLFTIRVWLVVTYQFLMLGHALSCSGTYVHIYIYIHFYVHRRSYAWPFLCSVS